MSDAVESVQPVTVSTATSDGKPHMSDLEPRSRDLEPKWRGFASLSPERMREICSKAGRAAHAQGKAYKWTSETARLAGLRSGERRKRV